MGLQDKITAAQFAAILNDYYEGMLSYDVVPSFVSRLDKLTNEETTLNYRQIFVENKSYTCGGILIPLKDGEDCKFDFITFKRDGFYGFLPAFVVFVGEFKFFRPLTLELIEYMEARDIKDDAESIGTCAGITMNVESKLLEDFEKEYRDFCSLGE